MTRPVGSLSAGPACETAKLIVQVIGKEHSANQKIVLHDAANKVQKARTELQEKQLCSSVLHVWDCAGATKHQLFLEIASAQGEPIRLPLLADALSTSRQADAQWNQLVPVLPFVSLPGSKSLQDYGVPVLARSGFIYVFYQEKLWRELEVEINDGQTTFRDIDIAHFRRGKGFENGQRNATGLALEDIWLPARWNNTKVQLQICFSEIQLGAARLQRLEQDSKVRRERCQYLQDPTCSESLFKERYKDKADGKLMLEVYSKYNARNYSINTLAEQANSVRLNLGSGCFPISVVAPQRAREPGFEWLLDHPARFLCDLTGQFPVMATQQAQVFLTACNTGTAEKNDPVIYTELLELSAVADVLEASLAAPRTEPSSSTEPIDEKVDSWLTFGSSDDVLAKARRRQICGVLLEDPRYRLRHLKQRLETHHQLLSLCARHAAKQTNHASALIVQQLVVPPTVQGTYNPLHASLKNLPEKGKQDINRCTAVLERAMVWQHMGSAQQLLIESLEDTKTQQALADHLSLEGFDYVAALFTICQTVATLAPSPSRLDPLAPGGDVVDAVSGLSFYRQEVTPGQRWLHSLANSAESQLHFMLWPECDMERVCKPYRLPIQAEKNNGDGNFRACELAKHENQAAPSAEQQITLDTSILANLLEGPQLGSFLTVSGKNISSALLSIYDTLQGAVATSVAAIDSLRLARDQAITDAAATHAEQNRADNRLDRTRRLLGARTQPVKVKLHAQGIEQLRSMLPNTFGAAYFMRRAQVTQNYYLFGLEDLPSRESVPRTFYGEFLDNRGALLGSTSRARLPAPDVNVTEHHVLVIPRNHSTAQLISHMNKQLTVAQQSAASTDAANSKTTQANTALAHALDQSRARSHSAAFKVLNSRPFSLGVLMIEMWNVNAEWQGREISDREKGKYRTRLGFLAAGIDLVIAMEALTIKLAGTTSTFANARKPIFKISDHYAKKLFGKAVADRLTKTVTTRLITQSLSGSIFAGLSLYDAWFAWQWNDNAMYGYLLISGGAIAGLTVGLVTASPIIGLTPLGWLALFLIAAGAGLVLLTSSNDLKDWLLNGPFSSSYNSVAKHLKDPQEAFYRLVSILSDINISIKPNTLFEPDAKLDEHAESPYEVRTANTVVRIESRLPGLLGGVHSIGIEAECRMREIQTTYFRGVPSSIQTILSRTPPTYKAQRFYTDALELYVDTPKSINQIKAGTLFEWAVRAQLTLKTSSGNYYFPAPSVKDPTRFGTEYFKADFNKIDRPFWADEKTHGIN